MTKTLALSSLFAASLVAGAAGADEHHLKPGEYQFTTTMQMAGMPAGMGGGARTATQCIRPEDTSDKAIAEKAKGPRQSDCKISDMNRSGSTVTWKVECPTGNGNGKIVYSGEGYDMTMQMSMHGRNMQMHTVARRTGDCK